MGIKVAVIVVLQSVIIVHDLCDIVTHICASLLSGKLHVTYYIMCLKFMQGNFNFCLTPIYTDRWWQAV